MNRRRFILKSLGATLALPALPSLLASAVGGNSSVQVARGAGTGARRFVVVRWLTEAGDPEKHARAVREVIDRYW